MTKKLDKDKIEYQERKIKQANEDIINLIKLWVLILFIIFLYLFFSYV